MKIILILFLLFNIIGLAQIRDKDLNMITRLSKQDSASIIKLSINNKTVPEAYKLEQNYPNPFNPVTVIEFHVPSRSFVILRIFNLLGKEVSRLFSGYAEAGIYKITFNSAAGGINLPSGIYIYQISTQDFTASKKMTLLK